MEEDENESVSAIGNLTCVMEKMQMVDKGTHISLA